MRCCRTLFGFEFKSEQQLVALTEEEKVDNYICRIICSPVLHYLLVGAYIISIHGQFQRPSKPSSGRWVFEQVRSETVRNNVLPATDG